MVGLALRLLAPMAAPIIRMGSLEEVERKRLAALAAAGESEGGGEGGDGGAQTPSPARPRWRPPSPLATSTSGPTHRRP